MFTNVLQKCYNKNVKNDIINLIDIYYAFFYGKVYNVKIIIRSDNVDKKLIVESKKYKGETSVVSARLPIELTKEVDKVAEASGRTRNEILIMCLEFALKNIEIKKDKGDN